MQSSLVVRKTDLKSSTNPTCQNINHLPDDVLLHVLYFLPTNEAAATSLLSQRWRSLWTRVPVIDCDHEGRYSRRWRFSQWVSKLLALDRGVSLDRFCLKCDIYDGRSYLNSWIDTVSRKGPIREVHISISSRSGYDFLKFPCCGFSIKNLQVLKLSHAIIDVPDGISFSLPGLKILHLKLVKYANNESISRLFHSCTDLEELVIDRNFGVKNLSISIPTLNSLSYTGDQELNINVPNLEYLTLMNLRTSVQFESGFISLIKASTDFHKKGGPSLPTKALCNAKFLSLWSTGSDIRALLNDDFFPLFLNLTKLQIDVKEWDVIPLFLGNSLNLEVLIVNKINIKSSHKYLSGTRERRRGIKCASPHLRQVYDGGFLGLDYELELVECILKNSRALELFEICCHEKALEPKFQTLQKLSKFPRASKSCQLIFDPDILLRKDRLLK